VNVTQRDHCVLGDGRAVQGREETMGNAGEDLRRS